MQPSRGLQPRNDNTGRAAVLALDVISDFAFPDGARVRAALATRATAIRALLARARSNRIPVVYANDNLGPWRSDSAALIARCIAPERAGAELVRGLLPAENDSIILKPRHSAFFGTPLNVLIDDLGIDTLILIGVSAESCVWMTACDAHTRGLDLIVPVDSIAGASRAALSAAVKSLKQVLGARTPARAASLRLKGGKVR
ncbi:MAG TPA: isochorismatase family cysteine hydrolase [Steroidobacteraceae bacterium]|nr:isochorismatase family cysteine hydrolase [Steroidobacteraceae bacterium]